jgi:hypothetical protein
MLFYHSITSNCSETTDGQTLNGGHTDPKQTALVVKTAATAVIKTAMLAPTP